MDPDVVMGKYSSVFSQFLCKIDQETYIFWTCYQIAVPSKLRSKWGNQLL